MRHCFLLSLLALGACTPAAPEDVRGTAPGTKQEPDFLTDTGLQGVPCEEGPAFPDDWAGGLDPSLVTSTPPTTDAGIGAVRSYLDGEGGAPPFALVDAVVLNLTSSDGAVDTLWLGDGSGALLTYGVNVGLTAAEVQPGDTVSLTVSAASLYQGLYEITGIDGLVVVTGDAQPIYVVDGNTEQVSVGLHAGQNVRGYGTLVGDEGECGSRQCFTFRYGANDHTLRVGGELGLAVGDCVAGGGGVCGLADAAGGLRRGGPVQRRQQRLAEYLLMQARMQTMVADTMKRRVGLWGALVLGACAGRGEPEDTLSWYDVGAGQDVEEAVTFTDVAYDFPADSGAGLGGLIDAVFPVSGDGIAYADGDSFGSETDCDATVEDALPWELEVVVTIHPRFYFKTDGCGFDSDEKYYGSFFAQDSTGGVFVLGDTKVADFDAGTRVRMRVRGVRTSFDLNMVYAHDIEEIVERDVPVYFEVAQGELGADDVGEVRRVEGVVVTEPDTFGEFQVEADDGTLFSISLDTELNRRGVQYPLDSRVQATGPVLYSYSLYSIIIMEKGQVTLLD